MFSQQINGIIRLSLPLIFIFNTYPIIFSTLKGQFFCALMMGAYICYCHWTIIQNFPKSLLYSPTGDHKELLDNLIKECEINPENITLRYAYTNESIALANGKTIVVDPVVWHNFGTDSEAIKVTDVFEKQIQPILSPSQKKRIAGIHTALNPAAQRFIFKHELGHVCGNFSQRHLVNVFIIGTLAAYSGITVAMILVPTNGFTGTILGMTTGNFFDILLTYVSNFASKLPEEKRVDRFAAHYSSREDIEAAAKFFEEHQEILDTNKEPGNFLSFIPSAIRTGHPNGKSRAAYLKELAAQK